eukprot:CAMPEP_0197023436 /NCGR_PEP_ID=MMETSP1384-20130603/4127_1 /TAXON_ID=29189 /ORGANISM="Ammonia sp." /LENGTH=804 /DNA_ID=CAMNT_0042451645 /DNA_START=22 /DNA_END=2433 /DNA_ORIENTATION=+
MAEQKSDSVWQFDKEEFDLALKGPKITDEEIGIFRDIAFKIRHPDGKREVPWPSDCQPQREVFGHNGRELAYQYIYEWETNNQWSRAYEIEVNSFIALEYTVNFEGTENCDIQTAFDMKAQNLLNIQLQPYEKETVFMVSCKTKDDNKYSIKGSWKKGQIDPQLYREAIIIANNKIKDEYNKCIQAGCNENVSWKQMPDIIRNNGLLFVDGEMFPGNEGLFFKGDQDPNAVGDKNNENYIQWRRAGDFLNSSPFPSIFKNSSNLRESVQPQFIRQGDADNAWLVAVISVCCLKPQLIANLFLSKDGSNDPSVNNEDKMYGFYRMKLCDKGIWTECILDDLFPCRPYWLPVMANTPLNDQLWPHLIEKLAAKMKGNCYQALDGGSPADAFADLTGCPTETYDLREYDTDLVFEKIHKSYNQNNYNLLAVAICNEGNDIQNVEDSIGLLSTHTYSVLAIDMNQAKIKVRDPFGRNEEKFSGQYAAESRKEGHGMIWLSFDEFVQYFTSVIVCYSENDYKEARQTIDISFDAEKKEVSVPVLKLTVPNGGNVEYLGLSQKDLTAHTKQDKNVNASQLDLCLFVFKASSNAETLNAEKDEPYGYIPMSTQRNKFVKFGASDDDVKSNDLSSGVSWKNGDRLTQGSYFLVPWTSGIQWESEQKMQANGSGDVRYIGLTVHGKTAGGDFALQPVDGYSGQEVNPVLMRFAFKYGEKKQWQDLERRHFQMGQLDIYCGRNTCKDKNLLFTMTPTEYSNTTSAAGYQQFQMQQEVNFKIEVDQSQLFAVNVPRDATKEYSSVYKYGLQNEWL